jgi:dienelactone hydrolase
VPGAGGRRYGVNSVWARSARRLAERGWNVLRLDLPGRGDSGGAAPGLPWLPDVLTWMRTVSGAEDLFLVGVCNSARVALQGSTQPGVRGVLLIAPYLRRPGHSPLARPWRRLAKRLGHPLGKPLDRSVRRAAAAIGGRIPIDILSGTLDPWIADARALERLVAGRLRLVPEVALHQYRTARAQALVIDHLPRWVEEAAG